MSRPRVYTGDPDRLYTLTGGRSQARAFFDLVTHIVTTGEPTRGMQSECAAILALCERPTVVAEIAAHLRLPLTVVRILLGDLQEQRLIRSHDPPARRTPGWQPDIQQLQEVLSALHKL